MTQATQTDTGTPEFLSRKLNPELNTQAPKSKVTLATTAAPAATPKPAKVKAAPKPKVAKEAKPARVAATKPSTIKATAANPAKSIVPVRFKQAYAAHNDTNGSKLSLALKTATTMVNDDGREALDVAALKAIAKDNGIDFSRYEALNNGQKRMNVGNKLAGLVKNGTTVTIGKQKFASETAVKSVAKVEKAA